MHFVKRSGLIVGQILFLKNWVQHDQGAGNRTCLQAHQLVLPRSPDPRGRRTRRRLKLAYVRRNVTNGTYDRV